jgi:hypothetical protein
MRLNKWQTFLLTVSYCSTPWAIASVIVARAFTSAGEISEQLEFELCRAPVLNDGKPLLFRARLAQVRHHFPNFRIHLFAHIPDYTQQTVDH